MSLHALPHIFFQFNTVWCSLQRVTYMQFTVKFTKKTYIYLLFCENVTVTRGNTLQLLQNQANLIKNKK